MRWVTEATYLGGYLLKIRFDNGESKVVDLQPHLDGPVFEPLKDIDFFKSFYVNQDIDTIVWPNDADFSPDFLYEIGQKVSEHVAQPDSLPRRFAPCSSHKGAKSLLDFYSFLTRVKRRFDRIMRGYTV